MSTLAFYGASGRIGRLIRSICPGDACFIARTPAPWIDVVAPLAPDDEALCAALVGHDAMVLLAGSTVKDAQQENSHALLAQAAAKAARTAGVPHLVLLSSAAVYGRADVPCREGDAPAPVNAYGKAKLHMEAAARALAGADLAVTVLRLGNVAGADALLGGLGRGAVRLDRFADGSTPRRSYIGPVTLAHALAQVASLPPDPFRLVNLAQPGTVAMADLLDAAGLDWTPRTAPEAALPVLELDLAAALALLDLPEATPGGLVGEWRRARGSAT